MAERLTRKLLQKHFGRSARIRERWFFAGFKVDTPTGGRVIVTSKRCKIISGGDDVHRAVILLGKDLWGGIKAFGEAEQLMSMTAHGELCGVNVAVGGRNKWIFRDRKRMAAEVAFTFPRIMGNARFSTDEDLEKGGML